MNPYRTIALSSALLTVLAAVPVQSAQPPRQALHGHVRPLFNKLAPLHHLDTNAQLDLSIDLPLRNKEQLTNLLQELYQPGSTNFRHFLKPDEFAAAFGPTPADYQSVIDFAKAHHLAVTKSHSNRTLVGIRGSVGEVERAFHTRLQVYQHPKESRTFFAPDTEPSMDLATPVLAISGLDNYVLPKPNIHPYVHPAVRPWDGGLGGDGLGGSAPDGSYWGYDFQTAYVPNTDLTGSGQSVALFELGGYNPLDIDDYVNDTGLPGAPLQNFYFDGFDGNDDNMDFAVEVTSDIEMAIAMAPNLSTVYVYEGAPPTTGSIAIQFPSVTAEINDILNQIAVDNFAHQVSCSYGMDINLATIQIFQQMAAQGQSFFQASGDIGAYPGAVASPSDDPYITIVGGTDLYTDPDPNNAGAWYGEVAWLSPPGTDPIFGLPTPYAATGGGISTTYAIPWWQQGVDMSGNQGSTTMRNLPDVAVVSDNIELYWGETLIGEPFPYPEAGTSLAAPLWAAFTALVNQQAALNSKPPVGFLNPALYAIGKSANYENVFHDIDEGENTNSSSPTKFAATAGYDLCTGWGSMNDLLIDALLNPPVDSLQVTPPFGFTSFGPSGGPFTTTSQNYTLKNTGGSSLNWRVTNSANWLSVAPTNGSLAAGASTTVTVNFNSAISNFLVLSTNVNVAFANLSAGAYQTRQFDLYVGNGSFEVGYFSNWTLVGNANQNITLGSDDVQVSGAAALSGQPDELFVHGGLYGAYLGQTSSNASLSQNLATVPGRVYLVSFWLTGVPRTSGLNTPNDFTAKFAGNVLYNQTNLAPFGWTNLQFLVPASSTTSTLEFDFRKEKGAFGLDDVSVVASPAAYLKSAAKSPPNFNFSWTGYSGALYQVQTLPNLGNTNWSNIAATFTTNGSQINASIPLGTNIRQFYRVVVTNQ